jgi:hypothetical protein
MLDEEDADVSTAYHALAFDALLQITTFEAFASYGAEDDVALFISNTMGNSRKQTRQGQGQQRWQPGQLQVQWRQLQGQRAM